MIPAIKSEFRKLLTVRSTYVILLFCIILEGIFAFYNDGLKATASGLHNSGYLANEAYQAISVLMLLIAMIGVLLVTHEYRYNTIMYSMTSSNRRFKLLLAKVLTVSVFVAVVSLALGFLSPLLTNIAIHIKGYHLVHQSFPVWDIIGRVAFAGWAFCMLALIMAFLIRIQVGAIVAVFLLPGTIEPLIGLALKKKQEYLPFSSINGIIGQGDSHLSVGKSMMVVSIYIVVGWIVALILFNRRDAN